MCGQHIDRKCEKCGWGLPLLERRRLKVELKDFSPNAAVGIGAHDHDHDHTHHDGHAHGHEVSQLMTRTEALGEMDKGKSAAHKTCDPVSVAHDFAAGSSSSIASNTSSKAIQGIKRAADTVATDAVTKKIRTQDSFSDSDDDKKLVRANAPPPGSLTREIRLTRPWKTVYCERLLVERNWRKGRCTTKTLKVSCYLINVTEGKADEQGHTNGVMCLQYHTALSNPSYPVLITGSYDRTVRIWNLDTGAEIRTLRGHTRAIRALQFDQMLLFTGAMDGTVRMWNWRAGECLRVLEGHTDGVVSLNYNGYLLASGSADSTIQVWNLRSGQKFVLRGHTDWVNSVVLWDGKTSPSEMDPAAIPAFSKSMGKARSASPNSDANSSKPTIEPGAMLFSASNDETIKLWDLNTQTCIRTFSGHKAHVQSLKVLMVDMSEEEIRQAQSRSTRQYSPSTTFQAGSQSPPQTTASLHTGPMSPHVSAAPPGYDPNSFRLRPRGETVEPKVFVHSDTSKHDDHDAGNRQKKALLITGSLDGTIKLWDVDTGVEKATLFGYVQLLALGETS
jgi:F-box/WD-40 domain protein MET30